MKSKKRIAYLFIVLLVTALISCDLFNQEEEEESLQSPKNFSAYIYKQTTVYNTPSDTYTYEYRIHMEWDAVEGCDGYIVGLWRQVAYGSHWDHFDLRKYPFTTRMNDRITPGSTTSIDDVYPYETSAGNIQFHDLAVMAFKGNYDNPTATVIESGYSNSVRPSVQN
jgi:hypothetical protein